LFVNHLPNWQLTFEHERELQTVIVARAIEEIAEERDLHVVLAGDLDATPDAASVRFWRGRQSLGGMSVCYRDAWEATHGSAAGETFTPDNPLMQDPDWPFRRIDYVLVRCADLGGPTLFVARSDRLFQQPVDGVWASDHFGVWAELQLPARSGSNEPARDGAARTGGDRPTPRQAVGAIR
jgi:endonuclease/exonuclease/phosphatase family metal-dependent hydrolase